jgi:hypothetical protein
MHHAHSTIAWSLRLTLTSSKDRISLPKSGQKKAPNNRGFFLILKIQRYVMGKETLHSHATHTAHAAHAAHAAHIRCRRW